MIGGVVSVKFEAYLPPDSNYFWSFGDGATSTDSIPTHIYSTTGTFYVRLSVGHYENSHTVFINKDPVYTPYIAGTRVYHVNVHEHPSIGKDTFYSTPDQSITIIYVNEVTLSFDNSNTQFAI